MCGIVYSKSFTGKAVVPTIVSRYQAQKHRGSNGFGFYVPSKNRLTHNVKEGRILSLLKREKPEAEVLFHHRFPTSTANVRNGCHPYSTKDHFENNYVVVHNGVLRNEAELKKKHEEQGINYVSVQENGRFNDSEALTYDIAQYLEGMKDSIDAKGSIAFIAIKRDSGGKPVTLFFARNSGNPLRMKKTKYSLTLSSEGEGENIEINTLYAMSYDTLEITKRPCIIGTGYTAYTRPYTYEYNPSVSRRTYSSPHTEVIDEDDELAGLGFSQEETEDVKQIVASEVKEVKNSFLYEANYDTGVALVLAEEALAQYEGRQLKLDMMSMDEEYEDKFSETEINEYCGNEDMILYIEKAITELKQQVRTEAVKGEIKRKQIGFHANTEVKTDITYPVPEQDINNTQGCYPWSD